VGFASCEPADALVINFVYVCSYIIMVSFKVALAVFSRVQTAGNCVKGGTTDHSATVR